MAEAQTPSAPLRNTPPDPHPRVPQHLAPATGWDCHIHLFGPAARFRYQRDHPKHAGGSDGR